MSLEGRTVTLVVLDAEGALLGALPSFELELPYWQEASDVVQYVRERWGVRLWVLRLLSAERAHPPGGAVTLLAQLAEPGAVPELGPVPEPLQRAAFAPHRLRAPWAEPGGPACSIAWVNDSMATLGRAGSLRPTQHRTWNLSAIWRFDGDGSEAPVWLKQVPRFFEHEAAVLRWLERVAPTRAPRLIAAGSEGRLLLEHVAGDDRYGAPVSEREAFASALHELQLISMGAVEELRAADVPDRRGLRFAAFIRAALSGCDTGAAAGLLGSLEERLTAIEACGLPSTLVHGDFHPGNVRSDGRALTLIDWGDSSLGHPGLDILRLTSDCDAEASQQLCSSWARRWRARAPACEPERALELLRPLWAVRHAAIYAEFVRQIEPSEHPYHADDVPLWLAKAATR